jgi:hypothetical protein
MRLYVRPQRAFGGREVAMFEGGESIANGGAFLRGANSDE